MASLGGVLGMVLLVLNVECGSEYPQSLFRDYIGITIPMHSPVRVEHKYRSPANPNWGSRFSVSRCDRDIWGDG